MIITEVPQNVHKICFEAIMITFICDYRIDLIMFGTHHVKLIFYEPHP